MPRRTLALLAFLLAALLAVPSAIAQDAGSSAEYDDNTMTPPSPAVEPNATSGQQYNTHCWRPSPSHHSRCFRHDHRIEWVGSGVSIEWRPWVGVIAWITTSPPSYMYFNVQHTNFCSHYGDSPIFVHNCADPAGITNANSWVYFKGSWRSRDSGGSSIHATSSGCVADTTADGIRVRFEPGTSTEHLTHWYEGNSAKVGLAGSGVEAWQCLVPA
jgi:hypothetical protein